jgi:hypothetical protein
MATQLPQNPQDHLSELMCDADLGHLGTEKASLRGESLRLEIMMVNNKEISLKDWNKTNLNFYKNHKYFTKSAEKLFGSSKEKLIKMTEELFQN